MGLNMKEMASLSGLSYRQLDYWRRAGALVPSIEESAGKGRGHVYGERDLIAARLLARVSRAFGGNVPVHLVIRIVDEVRGGSLIPFDVDLGHGVSMHIGQMGTGPPKEARSNLAAQDSAV